MNPESNLSPQFQFIILCCKGKMDENDIKTTGKYLASIEHLEEVSMLAYSHGVYPLFYYTLMKHASDLIDKEMIDAMAYLLQSIKITNEMMTKELIDLISLFKRNGVKVLSFKGPLLAKMAYGDILLRQYRDLDILVKKEDFLTVHNLLSSLDYKTDYYSEKFDINVLFKLKHDCPYYNNNKRIAVEVHWDFFRNIYAINNSLFEPWIHTKKIVVNGHEINTLTDETHLLFHSIHGSKHRWEKIGWIVDIDRMMRTSNSLDWDYMINKAEKMGTKKMFLLGIFFAYKYFNTPLPQHIFDLLHEDIMLQNTCMDIEVQISKEKQNKNRFHQAVEYMNIRDSLYYKVTSFMAYMFSPTYKENINMNLTNTFYILYYPLRIIKVMYVLLRNTSYKSISKIH